ncbi:hypothetical protein [Suttonella ornithocola]|uniref:Uncharacterized protein n=1 Tax=Suttonella ornithocola TaxID=279832 RepID=A0A380RAW4_9GAMM|nr:hypothetical protein [Suttonella ornithocola]SUO95204.1 Uncharacterised protein [Suttonella ornithocola]SUQ09763.1 Uncharacterised protein [Suttonella ornithocola]
MSRLEVLKNSLAKKEAKFDSYLQHHFDDVRSTNGQPLNDKRNGASTMKRWEKQNERLSELEKDIEKTKNAIEREEAKIAKVEKQEIPNFLIPFLESGELIQWRKYPNRFFVRGVEKGRIIWDEKTQKVLCSYHKSIPNQEQYTIFRKIFYKIKELNGENK